MQLVFVLDITVLLEGIVETSAVRGMSYGVCVEVVVVREGCPCFEDTRSRIDEGAVRNSDN